MWILAANLRKRFSEADYARILSARISISGSLLIAPMGPRRRVRSV
jgi:hypothetical protein